MCYVFSRARVTNGYVLPHGHRYGYKIAPTYGHGFLHEHNFFDRHMYGWVIPIGYKPIVVPTHTSPFLG